MEGTKASTCETRRSTHPNLESQRQDSKARRNQGIPSRGPMSHWRSWNYTKMDDDDGRRPSGPVTSRSNRVTCGSTSNTVARVSTNIARVTAQIERRSNAFSKATATKEEYQRVAVICRQKTWPPGEQPVTTTSFSSGSQV